METDDKLIYDDQEFYKKHLPRRFGGEICGWVSKYREINFPSQY
jgi:hypothetical protein